MNALKLDTTSLRFRVDAVEQKRDAVGNPVLDRETQQPKFTVHLTVRTRSRASPRCRTWTPSPSAAPSSGRSALKLAGTHHIVAAATGAGKSTLTWNVVRALGPAIASGLVRVTGLDPKGGMELYPGRALFTFDEDDSPVAIADALDDVVLRMAQRRQRLRGASRDWSMSLDEPFELVKLAALTAYVPDRKLRERIAGSLQLVLSQGRALGFCVLACVQDPRKEILPFRDLYPTRIALRVTEDSHSNLTLGDGAKERGALCHLIREDTPGVGYLRLDGVAEPVRVRFGHVTDADIAAMATLWPAPPLPAAEPAFTPRLSD